MSDYRNRLQFGLAPHDWQPDQWAALEMGPGDFGRTWGLTVPENMAGTWTRNLWGPHQLGQLCNIPYGATVIFLNEPNLPYEPLHESAGIEAEYAADMYFYCRQIRPDIRWQGPAINCQDAWLVDDDGLPFAWFRRWIGRLMHLLRLCDRYGLPRPFEALDTYCLQWYETDANIPDAWRSPAWGAAQMVTAAQVAGLERPRPVHLTEIGTFNHVDVMRRWLDDCYGSEDIERVYWFTAYHEGKTWYSLLRANNSRRATGEAFVQAKRSMR